MPGRHIWSPGLLMVAGNYLKLSGRSQQSLLDCWAIAGVHERGHGRLQDSSWGPGRSQSPSWTAVWSPPLLRGRPLCCLVAPFAVWSPLSAVWSPLLLFLCLRNTYEGCTLLPRVSHVCHVIIRVFLGITFAPQVYYAAEFG